MSRKTILTLIIIAVVLIAGAGAAVAGFFMYREYEDAENLAQAEHYRQDGEFAMAANYYKAYLSRNREDVVTLRTYAEMNEKMLTGRRMALQTAANAYNQINTVQPDPELQDTIVELFERVRSWADVEYYASFFLANRPDDENLKYKVALAIDNQGRTADARDAYRALIDGGTHNPQVYANLAGVLLRQNYPQEAAGVIGELEQALPDDPATFARIGEYYTEIGNLELAEAYAQKALDIAPNYADALFLRAQLQLMQEHPEEAIKLATQVYELDPENVRTQLLIAVAQNYLKDHAGAVQTLKALDPLDAVDNPEVLIALAESQITANRLADVDETIALYKRAYPAMRLTLDYLEGRKALASGNASQAVTELTNVVELNPSFASAQYYLAVALLQSQQRDLGRVALESYLHDHPNDRQAQKLLDIEFGGPHDVASAEQRLRTVLETSTSPEDLFAAIRPILGAPATGDDPKTLDPLIIEALERMIELDSTFERAHQSLIFYHAEHGDAEAARANLDRALASGIPEANLLMATAAVDLTEKNPDAAQKNFEAALARQDFTVDKAVAWGNLFANQGHMDMGLAALSSAVEKNIGDAAAIIDLEKPLLLARHDHLDRAMEMLDALGEKYREAPAAQDRLTDLKLQFAQTLLRMPEAARQEQADTLLEEVGSANPNNPDVALIRAEHLMRQTPPRVNDATALLDRVLALDKNNVRALVGLARIYGDQGNMEQALEYGRRASSVAVGNLEAQLLVAQLQFTLQRHREAQETLVSLLATHPDSIRAMELLAQSYMATRNDNLARMTLDDMVEAAGTDEEILSRARILRSRLLLNENRHLDEAEVLLREQWEAEPENTGVLVDLAKAIAGQGRIEEAETLLTEFAEQHTDRPEIWSLVGQFYLGQNDPALNAKASSAFTRARLIDPNHVPSLRGQIEVQSRQGKPVETLQLANRYLESHPNDDVVLYQKSSVLYQLNRMDDALQAIDRALALNERSDYRYLRASIHLAQKRYQDALSDLQAVEPGGVTTANFDMALAEAYWGVGQHDEAIQYYDSARQKTRPGDVIAPERIQRFEQHLQENPAA